jgi:hypothetical protein
MLYEEHLKKGCSEGEDERSRNSIRHKVPRPEKASYVWGARRHSMRPLDKLGLKVIKSAAMHFGITKMSVEKLGRN